MYKYIYSILACILVYTQHVYIYVYYIVASVLIRTIFTYSMYEYRITCTLNAEDKNLNFTIGAAYMQVFEAGQQGESRTGYPQRTFMGENG